MNKETLDKLIVRYADNLEILYGDEHNELFKWRALKTFQKEWFSGNHSDFISRFTAATKDFSIFIDNSRMHPRNGVVKLYEKEPEEVERLFCNVLFAADDGDINLRQEHMDEFLEGMEELREKYFPANWSFKQDRHSASTFLAMYAPTENYVYKYSEAGTMAIYGEYGQDIGSGASFSLLNYYRMCDEVVEELKEHELILKKHFEMLDDGCYDERSLHLLAFDLMYCCRTYGYYRGLTHIAKKESIKQAKEAEKQKAAEIQMQDKIDILVSEIEELRFALPDVSTISLMRVEVTSKAYGVGKVVEHVGNRITVKFSEVTKTFVLDRKFSMRPTFENDEEVVEAYSEYTAGMQRLEKLERELTLLNQ